MKEVLFEIKNSDSVGVYKSRKNNYYLRMFLGGGSPGMCGNYGCVVNMDTTGCSGTCNQVKNLKIFKKLTSNFFKIE